MTVKILADSACDLSEDYYNRYDIDMIPLTVQLDGQEYQDEIEIKPTTVYHAMREGKTPKTSQISPQLFRQIFTSYAKADQPFIYPALSSELSGTYQTAKMIEQEIKETYPNAKMHVFDTKCASVGCGLVVLRAAQLAQNGTDFDTIADTITYHAQHMEHIFTVDDLEYLYRGGRVSKTAAFVGSFLKIKPILHVDGGKLIPLEKQRGSKKLFNRMLAIMEERGADLSSQIVGISHADDLETARKVSGLIQERFNPADILIDMVGATIGAHAGPGTIAIFFLNSHYK